jgi:predicted lipoprotein with Yx(FWY)xxD motif
VRFRSLLVVPLALAAVACGSSSSSSPGTTTTSNRAANVPPGLSTRKLSSLGTILVNQDGRTLYVFSPEKGGKIVCTGSCAALWPQLKNSGQSPSVSSALVHPNLVSSVADPSGGKIITYAGWPLHTYTPDTVAGSVKGQGVVGPGAGQWHVIAPSGQVVTKSASSSSSSSSGGYGSGY